jgi:broad specificity phosphatase PhoE
MRVTLICHGATAATRSAAFPRDEPLEARAVKRAAALSGFVARGDRAFTSPALRARQTAEALLLNALTHPALRDCDYGRWAGRKLEDVQAAEPNSVAAWHSDFTAAPHGGEPLADLLDRVSTWLDETLSGDGHTIAVTHPAVIRAAIIHVLDAPIASFWRIDVYPLSFIELGGNGQSRRLRVLGSGIPKHR